MSLFEDRTMKANWIMIAVALMFAVAARSPVLQAEPDCPQCGQFEPYIQFTCGMLGECDFYGGYGLCVLAPCGLDETNPECPIPKGPSCGCTCKYMPGFNERCYDSFVLNSGVWHVYAIPQQALCWRGTWDVCYTHAACEESVDNICKDNNYDPHKLFLCVLAYPFAPKDEPTYGWTTTWEICDCNVQ